MKLTRLSVALIILIGLAAMFLLAGCGQTQKTNLSFDQLITKADGLVAKAKTATVDGDKIDSLTQAQKDYSEAVGKATEPKQTAAALYGQATTEQALAKVLPEIGDQNKNLWAAHTTFTTILTKFGKNTASFASEVQKIVEETHVQRKAVAIELDKRNSRFKFMGVINFYQIMDFLVKLTGANPAYSYWVAIILITILMKVLVTPLTKAQFKAMKEMQKVSPLVKEIQEKYKGDQQAIGQKTMDLYKEHGINPFASCLPMLIQMPILLMLYQTIRMYQFQFEKGTFLWIGSKLSHVWSVPSPMGGGADVWVTARNLAEPDLILVVLYVISMYISTKLSSVDPTQAEQQKMMAIVMPVMFAFMFATFQSAFLLYWLVFNVIQTIQQYFILNKHDGPALATAGPSDAPKDDSTRSNRRRRRR